MFEASSRKTENIFEVILGCEKLKWDPIWNFFHWLCMPDQGHGLGMGFQQALSKFALGTAVPEMFVKQEFRVDPGTIGSGKWADLALFSPSQYEGTGQVYC